MNLKEAFQILDLNPTFDKKIIKRAYFKLAKKYHPDRYKYENDDQGKKIEDINLAYKTILSDSNDDKFFSKDISFEISDFDKELENFDEIITSNEKINKSFFDNIIFENYNFLEDEKKLQKVYLDVYLTKEEINFESTKEVEFVHNNAKHNLDIDIPINVIDGQVIIKNFNNLELLIKFKYNLIIKK